MIPHPSVQLAHQSCNPSAPTAAAGLIAERRARGVEPLSLQRNTQGGYPESGFVSPPSEGKALRKLRHPTRSQKLIDFLE